MAPSPRTPLAGRRVLVTRSAEQSAGLVERLRARGAEVLAVPLLMISAPDDPRPFLAAVRAIGDYDWLLLTSANAVQAIAEASATIPAALRLASAGPATARAIRSLFPGRALTAEATGAYGSEGLARALALVNVSGARMLFPVSDRSPATLAVTLRARGAIIDVVVAYRTTAPEGAGDRLRATLEAGVDAVTFASPSAVEAFARLGGAGHDVRAIVIGPSTALAAQAAGFTVAGTAGAATGDSLAQAVENVLVRPKGKRRIP